MPDLDVNKGPWYVLHWREGDGSASGVVPRAFSEADKIMIEEVLVSVLPLREYNFVEVG